MNRDFQTASTPLPAALVKKTASLLPLLCCLSMGSAVVARGAAAQLLPDDSLGTDSSVLVEGASRDGWPATLIEGGAARGPNLFHSFTDFNVAAGQPVYFANPLGIEHILSRVTGGERSNILGTLGVAGPADLFLLNPNGIVFGPNATLDVTGSFYATTAAAIPLGDGVFSATNPAQSSLLTVDPGVVFTHYLTAASGDIIQRGQLATPGDLTLAAHHLDVQGQVAAGGALTLLGLDTVQIRDTAGVPFIGLAGGDLLVQGQEQVDIVALSHPNSGLYSGGDLVLRSPHPVGGDAHYWSAGDFRVETLAGAIGDLFSPVDPVIRAGGDVQIDGYFGSSLHILAGGAVELGTAFVTAPDPGAIGVDFLRAIVPLTDGTLVNVDGGAQPTVDIRAGVAPEAIGLVPPGNLSGLDPATDVFFEVIGGALALSAPAFADPPSTADITVGDIVISAPNGLVLLTNQYAPNLALAGGHIRVTGGGLFGRGIDTGTSTEPGGAVFLDARQTIAVTDSYIRNNGSGELGDIVLLAAETVSFGSATGVLTGAFSNVVAGTEGTGGDVRIRANHLEVRDGAQLNSLVFGRGDAGSVILDLQETARFVGFSATNGRDSGAFSAIQPGGAGQGGDLAIRATHLEVLEGAVLGALTLGVGDAGSVRLEIAETARFAGFNALTGNVSGAFSTVEPSGEGDGGDVELRATNLAVLGGATLNASTFGQGNAGSVRLEIAETARFVGSTPTEGLASGALSRVEVGGTGTGGDVEIRAANLEVLEGAVLSASTFGQGNAGSVRLEIAETAWLVGVDPVDGSLSGGFSTVEPGAVGNGGNVELRATNLEMRDGAVLNASTFGRGNAGNVVVAVTETARFVGSDPIGPGATGLLSDINAGGQGQGGNVEVRANHLEVIDGAQLSAAVSGIGTAGNVILDITETARFTGTDPAKNSASGILSSIEPGGQGRGGNIEVRSRRLEVLDGAQLSTAISGVGVAGDIILDIAETARFVGAATATDVNTTAGSVVQPGGSGQAGNLFLQAENLEVLDGARLSTSILGTGEAGDVIVNVGQTARFVGVDRLDGLPSGANSAIDRGAVGRGGRVVITATNLEVSAGAQLNTTTFGEGPAGSILLNIRETARLSGVNPVNGLPSGAFSQSDTTAAGASGNLEVRATNLELRQGAALSARSLGPADAGNIRLRVVDQLLIDDGTIGTNAAAASGGSIDIQAGHVILRNDGDIQTFVNQGAGGGGNLAIAADFVIALDDSDILAFSPDGLGGNIDLSRTTLFSQTLNLASDNLSRAELAALDGNDRVDINATGGIESGQIFINDASFVENSLNELTSAIVDPATLTAGSCIARRDNAAGSFVVTGGQGLPQQPGDDPITVYPTGTIQMPMAEPAPAAIQEPQGIYQLADGRLVLSHECE